MWYKTGKTIAWIFLKVFCGFEIKGSEYLPEKGKGFILVSNHASNLDPLVLGAACRQELNFMAKEELFKNRFFGWILRKVNAFPLRREVADISAIRTAMKRVNAGGALLIFPEGGRSVDGKLGPAHEGVGFLASKLNVPVVPAYIQGTDKAMPKGAVFIRPTKILVRFGKQITLERRVAYSDAANIVMRAIKQLSCCESN